MRTSGDPRDLAPLARSEVRSLDPRMWVSAYPLEESLMHFPAVQSMMFGVSSFDPMAFAGAAALLTLIGLAAAWIPARRASTVDPAIALRSQ